MQKYREEMERWVWEALNNLGGQGTIVGVAKDIWRLHEAELKSAGDRFYLWQYDMRWAANSLRRKGKIDFRKNGAFSEWYIR